jgi:hypothetical protein
MAQRYRLKLSRLDFVSLVDEPAQPNAKVLLLKRAADGDHIAATARFVKASDSLGLAFFWAFTSTNPDGSDHYDLHGDAIDGDFVKAAMDFMLEGGGAVDEMHDGEATDGRVVFAMPMTPEIAKAFSIETQTTGLMVALKVNDEQLAKLKDKTYTGVSIAGIGTREPVAKGRVFKSALFTDEVKGHAHKICVYSDGSLSVEWATASGADMGHSHGIVRNADGSFTVLADSGHDHVVVESPTTHAPTVIAMRAKSTRKGPLKKADTMTLDEALAEIEDLKAKLAAKSEETEEAEKRASLTDGQRAHLKALDKADAKAFLAKSFAEREAVLAEIAKANGEVYKSTRTGQSFRASDDPRLVEMAKQADRTTSPSATRRSRRPRSARRRPSSSATSSATTTPTT